MKLSAAIRKGSKKHRKTEGNLFNLSSSGTIYSCALGAAFDGAVGFEKLGIKINKELIENGLDEVEPCIEKKVMTVLKKKFPVLNRYTSWPRSVGRKTDDEDAISDIIVGLNDDHGWSRGRIANWLDRKGF